MAAGAGGEAVLVYFTLTDGTKCEAFIPARTWARAPSSAALSNRQWWLTATKTPWIWNSDVAPKDAAYDVAGAVLRFGNEVRWGDAGTAPAQPAPYQVLRCKGVDYAYGPGVFIKIDTEDMYFFLVAGGLIDVPHGAAQVVEENLRDFVRNQSLRGVLAGAASGDNPAVTGV